MTPVNIATEQVDTVTAVVYSTVFRCLFPNRRGWCSGFMLRKGCQNKGG